MDEQAEQLYGGIGVAAVAFVGIPAGWGHAALVLVARAMGADTSHMWLPPEVLVIIMTAATATYVAMLWRGRRTVQIAGIVVLSLVTAGAGALVLPLLTLLMAALAFMAGVV